MHFPVLTYSQDAEAPVPVFCCFWFQKSYTGNILGIGRNKSPRSYFPRRVPEHRRGDGEGPRGGHPIGRRGPTPGRAAIWCGPLGHPPALPLRLLNPSIAETLVPRATIREKLLRRRRRQSHLGGFWRSPPAPCRRGESSPEGSTSPCPPPD